MQKIGGGGGGLIFRIGGIYHADHHWRFKGAAGISCRGNGKRVSSRESRAGEGAGDSQRQ